MQILLAHKAIFQSEKYLGPTGIEILMFKHDAVMDICYKTIAHAMLRSRALVNKLMQ